MRVEARYILLAGLVALLGCEQAAHFAPQDPSGDRLGSWAPDPGATILRSPLSSLDNPTLVVVSDSATWSALWSRTWAGDPQPQPGLPGMDFVLSSVVVVGLGRLPGPGYQVTIDSIVVHTGGAVLYATEGQPGSACSTAPGTSSPVHMVRSPGHPPVIDWHLTTMTDGCPPAAGRM